MTNEILDKIEKIIRLQENAATEGEANAAAAALSRLLTKHNMDEAAARQRLGKRPEKDSWLAEYHTINFGKTSWSRSLYYNIAKSNFCRMWYLPGTHKVGVVGERVNIDATNELHAATSTVAARLVEKRWIEFLTSPNYRGDHGKAWKNSYMLGFVAGVRRAMIDARRETLATVDGGSVLAILKDQEADAALERVMPNLRSGGKTKTSGRGYNAGYADGRAHGHARKSLTS